MKKHPLVSLLLSLFVPGLGQMYAGQWNKGAAILALSIIIGSLNIIFLPIFVSANPDPKIVWSYWIPRIGHDVLAVWSIVFWIWVVADAYRVTKNKVNYSS
jgi:TM2 domain-containing membrane protein YozV